MHPLEPSEDDAAEILVGHWEDYRKATAAPKEEFSNSITVKMYYSFWKERGTAESRQRTAEAVAAVAAAVAAVPQDSELDLDRPCWAES